MLAIAASQKLGAACRAECVGQPPHDAALRADARNALRRVNASFNARRFSLRTEFPEIVDVGRYLFSQMMLLARCQQLDYPDCHFIHGAFVSGNGLLLLR